MKNENNAFRVFVDTNIFISAIHSKKNVSRKLLLTLSEKHQLLLCTYTLMEISSVITKRFPHKLTEWDHLLTLLEFELIYTPENPSDYSAPYIRDEKDLPVLVSAIIAKPDMMITGDKDFFTKEIQGYLTVYSPSEFLRYFT